MPDVPVAVTGVGVVVPGADGIEGFWRLLTDDRPAFGALGDRFDVEDFGSDAAVRDLGQGDRMYTTVFGSARAPAGWGSPEEADKGVLLLRSALRQALDGVRLPAPDRTELFLGASVCGSGELEEIAVTAALARRAGPDAGRVRALLAAAWPGCRRDAAGRQPDGVCGEAMTGLVGGSVTTVDAACASSLFSVDIGVRALRAGTRDLALCGGLLTVGPLLQVAFSKLGGLSRTGDVRAFDQAADGTLLSDGAAVVTLKRLADAERCGDPVWGVITGFGAASTVRQVTVAASDPESQERAIRQAREAAGTDTDAVDWFLGHGTATRAGDAAELEAVAATAGSEPVPLSSNKSLVGHTGWASGAVSIVHALLALRHGVIPAQRRFTRVPPKLAGVVDRRLYVNTVPVPLARREDRARNVSVAASGFGGISAHLLVSDEPLRAAAGGAAPVPPGRAVLLDWTARLPGLAGRREVGDWLRSGAPAPARTFDQDDVRPNGDAVVIPPRTLRTLDRAHLLALSCGLRLREDHGTPWQGSESRTGALVAHTGLPRTMVDYAQRVHHGRLARLAGELRFRGQGADADLLDRVLAQARGDTDPITAGALPGYMTNVIASRLTSLFHLSGLSLTVDSARGALPRALSLASSYLTTGVLDFALVLAVSANASDWAQDLAGRQLGEAAFLLVLTTQDVADARGLTPLAALPDQLDPVSEPPRDQPSYLAADDAIALLRSLSHA
ncbi:beta-ketoacyl synthase N-terminal-like domain-containing protein [Actinosynnema sp. NPDC053489]|uniref:beta-ketoacyl synthase N-terminal-like domain-containing protein n=1 Tax=Actinosynnema sp. NPDC053489 TaxID=3363916 RepID=UPI0037C989BE